MKFTGLIPLALFIYPLFGYADFKEGGDAYLKGDYEAAANEFIPLAERGDHRAMYALGAMYSEGHGVEKNLKKAYELFYEAAKNGRADAMYKLGLMYEEGIGVKQNPKKAIRYYQKSAKQGYPLGQYRFGLMYAKGIGVKQNPINAYAWLTVAGHYFIYETADIEDEEVATTENQQQLIFFQKQEKEKVLNKIIEHLQKLNEDIATDDIEKIKQKVIKFSKYRKKYRAIKFKNGRLESKIENLFLPETLY
jgi:Sel1 repeat